MQYKQTKVKLLGSMIGGITQKPIDEKKQQIIEFKTPETVKELQSFLGFVNYYRKCIKNCAEISAPLYELVEGDNKNIIMWNSQCQTVFEKLRDIINSDIAIYIPDFKLSFVLTADTSNTGIGAVLQQDIEGDLKVIDWGSKKFPAQNKKWKLLVNNPEKFFLFCESKNFFKKKSKDKSCNDTVYGLGNLLTLLSSTICLEKS